MRKQSLHQLLKNINYKIPSNNFNMSLQELKEDVIKYAKQYPEFEKEVNCKIVEYTDQQFRNAIYNTK